MILSKFSMFDSKKSTFIQKQEASALLSNLELKTPLIKIPLLRDIFFQGYKMNEIVDNFLLAGDTFMPEMHLRQQVLVDHLPKKNKEHKTLRKQEI